ncbi:hypothetical protein CsSME_00041493 [Camellia sinensis var. sinensis]|uniref:myb-like protein X n=1 Tax=Camellia sinensis TaxID=4442 RepID=UPI001035AC2B|nr:myb-like protein X [Camellia sinensis]XP_028059484.1 myb-like protein X [Camellia sinensis]XP_028059485.1 myb-like protein X [Camellia sinensis]XP_028059486.1 myb-like protein X [Camellia sinensis]XP_028059487.1 myb-like protein X [Camellia sinensis]
MSRCFPFPPPGYEKKARLSDTDLLTKEKNKEKGHKKDKKDKEKTEGKERKKDKEISDKKHKEKKDRKEKHKDRKDKDRDKEKKKTLDKKNIVGPLEGQNGEKLGSNCLQGGETAGTKFLLELVKRIRDDGGARENQMLQSISVTDQGKAELPGRVVESNIGNSIERKEKNNNKREVGGNVNGQKNKIEARGVENAVVQDFSGMDQKGVEGAAAGPVDKDVKKQREGKEKHKHKDGGGKGDKHKDREREKKRKSKDKDRTKEKEKAKEKAKEKEPNKEQPILGKGSKDGIDSHNIKPSYLLKEGDKSSTDNGILGKRKELKVNGFLHDDDIRPNKLPRSVSSSHQLVGNGRKLEPCQAALQVACERQAAPTNHKVEVKVSSCHLILQNGRKLEPKPSAIESAFERQAAASNHKVEVKVSSRPQILQNGRKLESHPSAIEPASERQSADNSGKTDKEARVNGLKEAQQLNACSSKPLSSTPVRAKEKVEASVKLPHPDYKYLSQILSVPEVAELSDFDDQDWLFSSDTKASSFEVDGTPQVWAEAFRIESADVTALPYVIPF